MIRPQIPAIPDVDQRLVPVLRAIKENIEILTGVRGNGAVMLNSDGSLSSAGGTTVGGGPINGNDIESGTIPSTALGDGVVTPEKIRDGAIDLAKFAQDIVPVEIVSELPEAGNFEGRVVFWKANGKLYRRVNGEWVAYVDSDDIRGTLAASQISAVEASKITGQMTSDQIEFLETTKLAGQIGTTQISDNAIQTPQILAGAVVTEKIAAGAVVADNIAANAITSEKIEAGAVIAGKIAAGSISALELAANSVTADAIAANAITAGAIAADAVTAGTIAAGAVRAEEIAAGEIAAYHIAANTITGDRIAANTITADKIDSRGLTIKDANGNVILSAGVPLNAANIAGLGDLAFQNEGQLAIAAAQISGLGALATQNSVSASNVSGLGALATQNTVNASSVSGLGSFALLSQINTSNIGTYIQGAAIGTAYIANAAISTAQIQDLAVNTLKIANNAVSINSISTSATQALPLTAPYYPVQPGIGYTSAPHLGVVVNGTRVALTQINSVEVSGVAIFMVDVELRVLVSQYGSVQETYFWFIIDSTDLVVRRLASAIFVGEYQPGQYPESGGYAIIRTTGVVPVSTPGTRNFVMYCEAFSNPYSVDNNYTNFVRANAFMLGPCTMGALSLKR